MKFFLTTTVFISLLFSTTSYAGRCFVTITPCLAEPVTVNTPPTNGTVTIPPSGGQWIGNTYGDYSTDCDDSDFDPTSLIPDFVAGPDTCVYDGFVIDFGIQIDTIIVLLSAKCIRAQDDAVITQLDSAVSIYPIMNDVYEGFTIDSCSLTVTFSPIVNGIFEPLDSCQGFVYLPNPGYSLPDTIDYRVCITNTPYCSDASIIVNFGIAIPTIGEWGMLVLGGLLLAFGARKLV